MSPPENFPREERIEAERKLLAALCQSGVSAEARAEILRLLKLHAFAEPDYQVIFRALAAMPTTGSSDTRQALTQAVTRMGFPDLDLDGLFEEYSPAADEIAGLLDRL
jgi:DnaB-like helicase N terminal domain